MYSVEYSVEYSVVYMGTALYEMWCIIVHIGTSRYKVQCCWVRHSEDLVSYHSTMAHVPFDDQFFSHPQQQQGGIVRNSVV